MSGIETSRVWDAQQGLVTALKAAYADVPELAAVRVLMGEPDDLRAEDVFVSGRVDNWTLEGELTDDELDEYATDDESFTLTICILTTRAGEYAVARDRLKLLVDTAAGAVRTRPYLGGAVDLARVTGARMLEGKLDKRRQLGIEISVECSAYAG